MPSAKPCGCAPHPSADTATRPIRQHVLIGYSGLGQPPYGRTQITQICAYHGQRARPQWAAPNGG
jgi:hypothetical protein